MSMRILESFISVANTGSFEKSSKLLFVSAPALIKQMNKLESETELKLFHRTNRGVFLTDSGKIFYDSAVRILEEYHSAIKKGKKLEKEQRQSLRIGVSLLTPYRNCNTEFDYMTNIHENTSLSIVPIELNIRAFDNEFRNIGKNVDMIPYYLGDYYLESFCDYYSLAKYPFRIAVPVYHPLASKESLTYKDLEGQTIVSINGNINRYYDRVLNDINKNCSNVTIDPVPFFDYEVIDRAAADQNLIIIGDYLKDVHPSLKALPVEWNHYLPYGFYYSKYPSKLVEEVIKRFKKDGVTGKVEDSIIIEE